MPNRNHPYYRANDHQLERTGHYYYGPSMMSSHRQHSPVQQQPVMTDPPNRAFSAPTPSGDSFSTMTTDTAIKMSNMNKRDQNGGSNAPLLGHQTPHGDRRRGLGNDYVSDATLLTTTSTVGIISETKKPIKHKPREEETRPISVQTAHSRKRLKHPPHKLEEEPSAYRIAFLVVGCLVFVFACIFGTIYLIIYRMKLLEEQ